MSPSKIFKIENVPLPAFSVEDNQPIKGEVKATTGKYGIICFGTVSETAETAVCLSSSSLGSQPAA
jgi:hypothetical protein